MKYDGFYVMISEKILIFLVSSKKKSNFALSFESSII